MAFTYKIKPLEWDMSHRDVGSPTIFWYKPKSSVLPTCEVVAGLSKGKPVITANVGGNDFRRDFATVSEAKAWIEERHIDKVREYLEALE